jgi:germination protein M
MQCHEVRTAIPKLIDGSLGYEEEFAVRQHLHGCSACQGAYHAFMDDEQAISGYMRQAPYASVAPKVMEEIDRSRNPWWDAFMAGSYRLASVAGLVLVVLVVGAGAWMLRDVATSDPAVDDPPQQEVTLGTADDDLDEQSVEEEPEPQDPLRIGNDNIEYIVDRLDDAGLVFDVDLTSSGEGYEVHYGRVAVDRHLTLIEYDIQRLSDDARLMVGAFGIEGGGSADFSDGDHPLQGWLAVPAIGASTTYLELQDGETTGENAQNTHPVAVDLSEIAELEEERRSYEVSESENGVELCCMTVEPGIAVSTIEWDSEIVDPSAVAYVDEDLKPVDEPPQLDATVEPIYPDVTVDGEPHPVLELSVGQALMLEGSGIGVLDLPDSGWLDVHYEHVLLPDGGEAIGPTIYEGPWTLSADLEDVATEPEPTPAPTVPSDVAEEPMPTPEAEPEPTPVPEDDEPVETLRVLVYMVNGEELAASSRQIEYTQDVATAAIEALLAGPNYEDEDVGLHSEIPAGTELLNISLSDGTLVVDLSEEFASGGGSASMLMRVAQIVHTGTQFDSVENVRILIGGAEIEALGGEGLVIDEPLDRADFEDQAPVILIETPAPHETVGDTIRLRGTSNTFEAHLQIEIIGPMGDQIYLDNAQATSGTGTRGEFDLTIPIEYEGSGLGAVRMFEDSARDGSPTNVVTVPIWFE